MTYDPPVVRGSSLLQDALKENEEEEDELIPLFFNSDTLLEVIYSKDSMSGLTVNNHLKNWIYPGFWDRMLTSMFGCTPTLLKLTLLKYQN